MKIYFFSIESFAEAKTYRDRYRVQMPAVYNTKRLLEMPPLLAQDAIPHDTLATNDENINNDAESNVDTDANASNENSANANDDGIVATESATGTNNGRESLAHNDDFFFGE